MQLPSKTANWSLRPEQSSPHKPRVNLITLKTGKQLKRWLWKSVTQKVMWSCTLHFSAVEQIKLTATISVVISKMVFLSHSVSLFRCLMEISIDLWNLWHSAYLPSLSAPPLFAYYNSFLSTRVLFSQLFLNTLITQFIHLYADNLCVF